MLKIFDFSKSENNTSYGMMKGVFNYMKGILLLYRI